MIPRLDPGAITPMLLVGAGAVAMPLCEVLLARMVRTRRTWLSRPMTRELAGNILSLGSVLVLLAALIATLDALRGVSRVFNAQSSLLMLDGAAWFLNAVVLVAAILTVLLSSRYLAAAGINRGEFYALVLASVLGMMFLTAASDLIMLFLSLELMSVPVYALAGFQRTQLRGNEAALKCFLAGAFASAVLLYGCALLYGVTGSLALAEIGVRFDPEHPVALVGAGLLIAGLGFKIASVPFHQWAPDVYQGAPTTVTGFIATAVEVACFGALMRVMAVAFQPSAGVFYSALFAMAVASMTVGNVMALIQNDLKRMLAWSSIAHAGYMLVGLATGTRDAYAAVLFYLLVYTFMSLAAFGVLANLARDGREPARLDDLAGLNASRPFLAAVMALAMFALAGVPGTGGFVAKLQVVMAAVRHGGAIGDGSLIVLAVLAALNSALSLACYLRVPVIMYMRDSEEGGLAEAPVSSLQGFVVALCAAAILVTGLLPQDVFAPGENAVDLLAGARSAADALLR